MTWIRDRLGPDRLSERRACRVLGQPRSTQRRVREAPYGLTVLWPTGLRRRRPSCPGGMLEIHLRGMDHL